AGCAYADLERLVQREGIEGALSDLFRHGVYLTIEEFKGRRQVVRGSVTFVIDPASLRNPRRSTGMLDRSGGSRGTGTLVPIDLAFLRDRAVNARLFLDARRGRLGSSASGRFPGPRSRRSSTTLGREPWLCAGSRRSIPPPRGCIRATGGASARCARPAP